MLSLRKFKKIVLWFLLSVLILFIAAWIFIESPYGQQWLKKQLTQRLSKDLGTKVEIKHVSFSLFNKLQLEGTFIEDQHKDTLLYAGKASLRITDWFFFKKKVELKYIGLEDAVIHTHRTDSVWNYQFILDYINPGPTAPENQTEVDLRRLSLKNVLFQQTDEWVGQNLVAGIAGLEMEAKNINFSTQQAELNWLVIDEPYFSLLNYPGLRPDTGNGPAAETNLHPDSLYALTPSGTGWVVSARKVKISNGIFKHDKLTDRPVFAHFDDKHIAFQQINSEMTNLRFVHDSLTADIVLRGKERSGFEVKSMVAKVNVTPREMTFSDLDVTTNNSRIRNYFQMSFGSFSDMEAFESRVRMQGNFDNSEIDSDDIAFFAPELSKWQKNIILNGLVRGTVDELVGQNLVIQAGQNTLLNGNITLTGLPHIERTFIDFQANDFRTTYADAVKLIPAIRQVEMPDLKQIQYIHFKGSFTGFIRDFVTFGTIQTNLGLIRSDLNMKLPEGQSPLYSGTISADRFNLGTLISDSALGMIALNGSVKGRGFLGDDRQIQMDGIIKYADYNGYRYSNIVVNGNLEKRKFDGYASINDPEADVVLNGLIDFNNETPVFNFLADVRKANLKQLKLTDDSITFRGKFDLNFTGDHIDNFQGYAKVTGAYLTKNKDRLPFDSLIVSSGYANHVKTITAVSNEFDASATGNFTITGMKNAVGYFLNKYYPSYFPPVDDLPADESLTFEINTQAIDDYIHLVDTSISGLNYSRISGSINTHTRQLALSANLPQFRYKSYAHANDINLEARGDDEHLSLSGVISSVNVNNQLNVAKTDFTIDASHDLSKITINTGGEDEHQRARLNTEVTTYADGVRIEFSPSTFVVNGKTWTIDENGELEFRNNIPAVGKIVARESNQQVTLYSKPSESGNWNDLVVDLARFNMGDFSPFILPDNRLEGLLSGTILIEDPTHNLFVSSNNLMTEGLRFDNDSIGNVKVAASFNGKTNQLKAKGNTLNNEQYLGFDIDMSLDKDREKQKNNLIALQAKTYPLTFLDRFIGSLFSDIQGYVTGNFDIRGELDNLTVSGKGRLHDAGLKVNFTQCFYKIKDTEINLKQDEIVLDGLILVDPVTNNPVYMTGGIEHTAFKNMFYDIVVSTRKPNTKEAANNQPVLLLNTGFNDNKQFYGRVKGTGSFSLSGSENDLFMKIDAIASATDSSMVTIPSTSSRETGIADFLVERKYGKEMVETKVSNSSSNITYDVDVTANPMVTMRVVLDELTGDEIKGKGSGSLNIHAGSNENLTIRGRFDIEEGDYIFTFQSLFKKPFEIRKGADNYIAWSGDPYNAKIQFEAVYKAENVSFAPLVGNLLNVDPSYSKVREDVYVIVNLTGDLFKPDFKFGIEFSPNSALKNDFTITSNIQQIEKDESKINRQVTYLVVFNSFAPEETTATTGFGSTINELTYSTISSLSGLFFNEINKKLNSELARILNTDKVRVIFSGALYNRNLLDQQTNNGFNINQSTWNLNVPISLFKDRFVLTLGSTLDVPLQSTIQQNVQFLPDVTAEWLINQNGTVRASFFYRQNLDYLTTSSTGAARTQRSGASIAYRKEFDTIGELFGKKKNKDRKNNKPPKGEEEKPGEEKEPGTN